MYTENIKASDAKLQSLGLSFNFTTENDKLLIQASCSKNDLQYSGQIVANPYTDFQFIKQSLVQGEFKTLVQNEELLKIRIGGTSLELFKKAQSEIKKLKQTINGLTQKQMQTQTMVKSQKDDINLLRGLIFDLHQKVEKLKTFPTNQNKRFQEIKQILTNKVKSVQQNFSDQITTIKAEVIRRTEGFKKQLNQHKFLLQNKQNKQTQHKLLITKNVETLNQRINKNEQLIKKLQEELQKQTSKNKKSNQQFSVQLESSLEVKDRFNYFLKGFDKLLSQCKTNSISNDQATNIQGNSLQIQLPVKSFRWSENLRSKLMKINNKQVSISSQSKYYEFALLQVGFSRSIKQKQNWAIQIGQSKQGIWLGICLRKSALKNKFNDKKLYQKETGHGFYMIQSQSKYWSHSSQNLSFKLQPFQLSRNEIIYIQYDPIEWRLRFRKDSYYDRFELSIIPAPQGDQYHPCIGFKEQYYNSQQLSAIIVLPA